MKNIFLNTTLIVTVLFSLNSCKKQAEDVANIYKAPVLIATPISDAAPLCGAIKGTMLSGKTYTIGCDVIVNAGDTLFLQPGVHINVTSNSAIIIKGTFISNGTQANPNWITVDAVVKNNTPGADPATDPAFAGKWKGLYADTSCYLMVLKWTHVEFGGSALGSTTAPKIANTSNTTAFTILFQNYRGNFVMEDSWVYGGVDDPIRISNGQIEMFRNTEEKGGLNGGDGFNVKGGTVGDMAYNFFIGNATSGQKVSNKGQPIGAPTSFVVMYNNTFVNCGYRQIQTGRGANINFEEGAGGKFYNNLAVNCKFGYRVVNTPVADTAHLSYGYNYQYGDSISVANQFYPVGYITRPQSTDNPAPAYLPANYSLGSVYDGTAVVKVGNPNFINYPLPVTGGVKLRDIAAMGSFNFRLQAGSPCIGKGYTGINLQPLKKVAEDAVYGVTFYPQPGADMGAYQFNGYGNSH